MVKKIYIYFQVYNSVAFSTFTPQCNHHYYLDPQYSHHPQRKSCLSGLTLLSPFLQSTTNLLPIYELLVLDIYFLLNSFILYQAILVVSQEAKKLESLDQWLPNWLHVGIT